MPTTKQCTTLNCAGRLAQRLRVATLAAMLLLAAGLVPSPGSAMPVEKLAWLGGCWVLDNGEPGSGEHWMPLAGGTLLGIARTVKRGRTVDHEFMQIRTGDDGQLAFIAQPAGQQAVRFRATQLADDAVMFENPAHDFPQRISYQRLAGDRLLARIEGQRGGALRAFDFPMRRASCDALLSVPQPNSSGRSGRTEPSKSP